MAPERHPRTESEIAALALRMVEGLVNAARAATGTATQGGGTGSWRHAEHYYNVSESR